MISLGLCLAAFGDHDLEAALDATAGLGPLWLDMPTDTTLRLVDAKRCACDARYRDDVGRALAGRDIGCVSNSRDMQLLLGPHGPHTDPVWSGDAAEKRTHAVTCGLGAIRLASRLGAPAVRLLPGCPDFGRWLSWWGSEVSWADNVDEFRRYAGPLVLAAREEGVSLLLEPHPKQVVYDRASAQLLFDQIPEWSDVLRLCVDPANLAATGHDPVGAVSGWNGRMSAVHAKDLQRWQGLGEPHGAGWSRYGPQPPIRFRALGLGELDWARIVAALQDEEFSGVLYAEHEDALLPRQRSIELTLRLLRSLLPDAEPEGRTW